MIKIDKLILYGAGMVGAEALTFFGETNVEFFADSDSARHGDVYRGKIIIGIDGIKDYVKQGYTIVVTVANPSEIVSLLESENIDRYLTYRSARVLIKLSSNDLDEFSCLDSAFVFYSPESVSAFVLSLIYKHSSINTFVFFTEEELAAKLMNEGFTVMSMTRSDLSSIKNFLVCDDRFHSLVTRSVKKYAQKEANIIDLFAQKPFRGSQDIVVYSTFKETTDDEVAMSENRLSMNKRLLQNLKMYTDASMKDVLLFDYIEIETINRCNGLCSFCPVNSRIDSREKKIMPTELYEKIVDELADLDYSGHFAPFSNNEPLLDKRFESFTRYARRKLPKAFIYFFTNGTLLTVERFREIADYVDQFCVDNYCTDGKLTDYCKRLVEEVERNPNWRDKLRITIRNSEEVFLTRGGDSPNRSVMPSYGDFTCAFPFEQMVVRPDGKVSLCCNDALGKHTLGDVSIQSLVDVWFGDKYTKLREAISKGRKYYGQCEKCDSVVLR